MHLTDLHDSIFFQDIFSLENLDEDTILTLLETDDDVTIRVVDTYVPKRRGLIEIFALNKEAFLKIDYLFERNEYARRCHIVPLPADFIVNEDIVNIYNQIYNNPETIKANRKAILDT